LAKTIPDVTAFGQAASPLLIHPNHRVSVSVETKEEKRCGAFEEIGVGRLVSMGWTRWPFLNNQIPNSKYQGISNLPRAPLTRELAGRTLAA
jgi:hypothetical protein